jgi:preprotein translocase subunit SecY
MYGTLSGTTAVIVFLQLIGAGIVVLLLDELVQKGWGFGSGISLFIMAGVAQHIFWQAFTPLPGVGDTTQTGGMSYGFFFALGQALTQGKSFSALWLRGQNPSLMGLIATVLAFLIIIYMEGVRVELPLSYAGYKGYRSRYPIKLLYVSNLPVIFASALFANVYFFSQLFWSMSGQPSPGANVWLDILGQFKVNTTTNASGQSSSSISPIGGLVYYVTAPRSFNDVMTDPYKALGYLAILVAFCVIFSLTWLEVGGLGPSTVANQLVDAGMQIPGYRRSGKAIESVLKRYIPAVTVLGGVVVGLIAGITDFFGVFGSGMGILLSVGIIYQYYEVLMQERAAEMYPAFRRLFGE